MLLLFFYVQGLSALINWTGPNPNRTVLVQPETRRAVVV